MSETVPSERSTRRQLTDVETRKLRGLLNSVPIVSVERRSWNAPGGRTMLNEICRLQELGVPLKWIAQDLGIPYDSMESAVSYYQRGSNRRNTPGRRRRARGG